MYLLCTRTFSNMSKKEDNKDDNSTMPCIKIVPKTELYSSESHT